MHSFLGLQNRACHRPVCQFAKNISRGSRNQLQICGLSRSRELDFRGRSGLLRCPRIRGGSGGLRLCGNSSRRFRPGSRGSANKQFRSHKHQWDRNNKQNDQGDQARFIRMLLRVVLVCVRSLCRVTHRLLRPRPSCRAGRERRTRRIRGVDRAGFLTLLQGSF